MKTGTKFEATKDMGIVDIAKLVKADIAQAVKNGDLPKGLKVGIRTSRYSGGQSMSVTIKAAPGVQIYNPDRVAFDAKPRNEQTGSTPTWLSTEALVINNRIEAIVEAFNFDNSDPVTDYFNVKFYGNVQFDSKLIQDSRSALEG